MSAPIALAQRTASLDRGHDTVAKNDATILIDIAFGNANNCQDFADRVDRLGTSVTATDFARLESCRFNQKAYADGGVYGPRPSVLLYALLNAGVSVAAFGIIYALTFLLPAVARRYWRWLNT
jgi:hypothetical protein